MVTIDPLQYQEFIYDYIFKPGQRHIMPDSCARLGWPVYIHNQLWYLDRVRTSMRAAYGSAHMEFLFTLDDVSSGPVPPDMPRKQLSGSAICEVYILRLQERNHERAFQVNNKALYIRLYDHEKLKEKRLKARAMGEHPSIAHTQHLMSVDALAAHGYYSDAKKRREGEEIAYRKHQEAQQKTERFYEDPTAEITLPEGKKEPPKKAHFENKPLIINKISL